MKKYFIIMLTLVLIISSNTSFAQQQPYIELSSQDLANLKVGDTFTVNIDIKNVSDFIGAKIIVKYNPNLISIKNKSLTLTNITDFSNIEGVSNNSLIDGNDTVIFIFGLNSNATPISGDISIGSITFDVISKGQGTISIESESKLISEDINGNLQELTFNLNTLNYTVSGVGNLSGTIKTLSSNPINGAYIELVQNDITYYSASTSTDGAFNIENIIEGTYTLKVNYEGYKEFSQVINITDGSNINLDISLTKIVDGDITGDELVTLEDLVFAANYYGLSSYDLNWDENCIKADINKDNKIDVLDLIYINRRIK
ncbi:hypothetical protein TR13x_05045 [Caloranaerobacter sp. TR13]|uniref:carboxypeptidase regulatory-like domain-containing protein n=1 Tax=Caloranaerobacter sp. TR13 TaxID=1302151 RepID=UPI0006D47030|nr:carboxypeptidase regulatory-like domain-containing protein [Caloranaerobacter sp. TR13]KPU27439.1 hypothetical protein TR13x_05045 [Caloranaerobacter sp. TR13]